MTQIPEDVMKAAREAWLQASTTLSAKRGDPASVIARAIMVAKMQERGRAAAIADMHDHRSDISRAILTP